MARFHNQVTFLTHQQGEDMPQHGEVMPQQGETMPQQGQGEGHGKWRSYHRGSLGIFLFFWEIYGSGLLKSLFF